MIEIVNLPFQGELIWHTSRGEIAKKRPPGYGRQPPGGQHKYGRDNLSLTPLEHRKTNKSTTNLRFAMFGTRRAGKLQKNARRLWAATPGGQNSYYARIRYILGGIRTPDDGNVNDEFDAAF